MLQYKGEYVIEHGILWSQSDGEGEGHGDDNVPPDKSSYLRACSYAKPGYTRIIYFNLLILPQVSNLQTNKRHIYNKLYKKNSHKKC